MTTKLRHAGVWHQLTALAKKTRADVAVAYFGQDGASRLPLRRGSRLVVNLSKQTVQAGITDPREILKLIKRGVEVHTVDNLHAKVYVFGQVALIGSPNVSNHSANHLVEAAFETARPKDVAACREFVLGHIGDEVTKEVAEAFVPLWRPPSHPSAKGKKRGDAVQPSHERTWVAHLERRDRDEIDEREAKKGRPTARARLRRREALDEFVFEGGRFAREVKRQDIVVQVFREGREGEVYPAARVLDLRRYWSGHERRVVVYLAISKNRQPVELGAVRSRLGALSSMVSDRDGLARQLTDARGIHALFNAIARGS